MHLETEARRLGVLVGHRLYPESNESKIRESYCMTTASGALQSENPTKVCSVESRQAWHSIYQALYLGLAMRSRWEMAGGSLMALAVERGRSE